MCYFCKDFGFRKLKMIEITEKTIDIEAVLASKVGDKMRYVPRFLVNWLIRIAHQDELNDFLWKNREKEGVAWLRSVLDHLDVKIEVEGLENLPSPTDMRPSTFVCNHPLGGIDGVALGAVVGETYGEHVRYFVNDLLMNFPALAPLCIPVNKTGKQSRGLADKVADGFASDNHIIMFPAGLCSRLIDGKIQDIPWGKAFITKSIAAERDVVPVHFFGRNSNRFYRIAKVCKMLHLKVNIAMLFLSDEMFLNRGKTFRIVFGKPIPWQTFDKSKSPKKWAAWVREKVYEME